MVGVQLHCSWTGQLCGFSLLHTFNALSSGIMYLWKEVLSFWADSTLHVDALGLVTIGADEVNASIGRLVPSRYVEFLPAGRLYPRCYPIYPEAAGFHPL
jgi:hypothetical protein